jgi:hypothetical protein
MMSLLRLDKIMDPVDLTPEIGARGTFTVSAPFDTKVLTDTFYTCIAIRGFSDLTAAGQDPKTLYYTDALTLDPTRYDTDLAKGACIVTLQSDTGDIVYIPSSFIKSFPKAGGITYTTVALAISLSAIPKAMDLTLIKKQIQDVVTGTLGVTSSVKVLTLSPDKLIDTTEAAALEAARLAQVTTTETDRAARIRLEERVRAQTQQIQQLEAYILSMNRSG